MATKNVNKTRLLMKHDIEANWLKAENFIPLEGEIVVYDADETHSRPRMKIGDGKTQVGALPFATVPIDVDELEGSVVKTINGVEPDENGDIKIIENISYSFADASEVVAPGVYTWYGLGTVQEAATKIRSAANDVCVYRMIIKADSTTETYKHTGYRVLGTNEDGSRNIKVFFGDDLCPIILDAVNNKIIADPDWVAPEESATKSDIAGMVKSINGHTADENGEVEIFPMVFHDNTCYGPEYIMHYGWTLEQIVNLLTNDMAEHYSILRRVQFLNEQYESEMVELISWKYDDNGNHVLHFGNKYADIIINAEENTIKLDPNWVAPTPVEDQIAAAIEGLATESYVETAVANLVDSSPDALNTLNELAAALGDDPNFATTVTNEIAKKADKTITINGKPLTENISLTAKDVNADIWWVNVRGDADENGVITATSDKTYAEIESAINEGRVIKCRYDRYDSAGVPRLPSMILDYASRFMETLISGEFTFSQSSVGYGTVGDVTVVRIKQDNTIIVGEDRYIQQKDLPSKLPNPKSLTIKHGEDQWEYNGSTAVSVEIPEVEPTTSLPWESITNKPFGEDIPFNALCEFDKQNTSIGFRAQAIITSPFALVEGKTYKITAGDPATMGFETTSIAQSMIVPEFNVRCIGLGNWRMNIDGVNNGEPYSILNFPDGDYTPLGAPIYGVITVYDSDMASIIGEQIVPIKIDGGFKTIEPKYLGEVPTGGVANLFYEEAIDGNGGLVYDLTGNPSLVIGKEYQVTIQGQTFMVTAIDGADMSDSVSIVLRETAYLDNEGEGSFTIAVQDSGVTALFIAQGTDFDVNSTIDLKIEELNGTPPHLMLVTDENGSTKWVERTHYAYRDLTAVVPTITFTEASLQSNGGIAYITNSASLESGKTYIVNYNGTEYNCIATVTQAKPILANFGVTVGDDVMGGILGNFGPLDPSMDTGEPFVLMVFQGTDIGYGAGIYGTFMPLDGATNGSFAIYISEGEVVKKLDKKFMPDGLFYMEYEESMVVAEPFTTNYTYEGTMPALAPLEEGKNYVVIVGGQEFTATCKKFKEGEITLLYLGNPTIVGFNLPNDGESFFITYLGGNEFGYAYSSSLVGGITEISVRTAEICSKLPSRHIDFSDIEATDDEILEVMASLDMLPVVTDESGAILTDENSNILLV